MRTGPLARAGLMVIALAGACGYLRRGSTSAALLCVCTPLLPDSGASSTRRSRTSPSALNLPDSLGTSRTVSCQPSRLSIVPSKGPR
jgi:hypothetical protein